MVGAQLTVWSFPTQEDPDSNQQFLLNIYEHKDEDNEKRFINSLKQMLTYIGID